MKQIGTFIMELRKEKGLTQKQLADQLHISDRTVSKWERNIGYPDISMLQPLAEAFDIDVDILLAGQRGDTQMQKQGSSYLIDYMLAHMKKNTHTLSYVLCMLGMLAILICGVCDYAMTSSFSWSLLVAASIIFAVSIICAMLLIKEERILKTAAFISIAVFPYLWFIEIVLQQAWFVYPCLPIAVLSICYAWFVILLSRFWNAPVCMKIAVTLAFAPVLSMLINLILGEVVVFHWISFLVNECIAFFFFILGIVQWKRMHTENE